MRRGLLLIVCLLTLALVACSNSSNAQSSDVPADRSSYGELTAGESFSFSSGISFTVPADWRGEWSKAPRDTPENEEYETLILGPATPSYEWQVWLFARPTPSVEEVDFDRKQWQNEQSSVYGAPLSFETSAGPVLARVIREPGNEASPLQIDAWIDYPGAQPLNLHCELQDPPAGAMEESSDRRVVESVFTQFGMAP